MEKKVELGLNGGAHRGIIREYWGVTICTLLIRGLKQFILPLQGQASQTIPCTQISWGPYHNIDYDSVNVCVVYVFGVGEMALRSCISNKVKPKLLVLRLPE